MKDLMPQLFLSMKQYSKGQFVDNVVSGITVVIIALSLSIILALASGVTPEQGLYITIVAGFVIFFLGGSKMQIVGLTVTLAAIVAGTVIRNGTEGPAVATTLTGTLLIIMGVLRLRNLIRFIPCTITTGFTTGIVVTIFIGQIRDLMGLVFETPLVETMEKLHEVTAYAGTFSPMAVAVGALSLGVPIIWLKFSKKVPPPLVAVIVFAMLVKGLDLRVNTIGDLYAISSSLPVFHLLQISFELARGVMPGALTTAVLAAIESLLSCVAADGMVGEEHSSNMELTAQEADGVASALFGRIPAMGITTRTTVSIKNGGHIPVAGMVHAVVLLLVLIFLIPYAALIPMPVIATILLMVAYNVSEWGGFLDMVKTSPKSDTVVLLIIFFLTVVFDLVMAIGMGLVLVSLLFMKRVSDVSGIYGQKYEEGCREGDDKERVDSKPVPEHVMVLGVRGSMFSGAADKTAQIPFDTKKQILILRVRSTPAMDATVLNSLKKLRARCHKAHTTMILPHVNEQSMSAMKESGFNLETGRDDVAVSIDAILSRATMINRTTESVQAVSD